MSECGNAMHACVYGRVSVRGGRSSTERVGVASGVPPPLWCTHDTARATTHRMRGCVAVRVLMLACVVYVCDGSVRAVAVPLSLLLLLLLPTSSPPLRHVHTRHAYLYQCEHDESHSTDGTDGLHQRITIIYEFSYPRHLRLPLRLLIHLRTAATLITIRTRTILHRYQD